MTYPQLAPSDLRERRESLSLSRIELSSLTGISVNTIARIETGANTPRASTMRKLTEALDESQEPRKMTDSGQPRIFYEVHTNGLEMRVSVDPPRLTDEQFDRLFALIEQIRSEREDQ